MTRMLHPRLALALAGLLLLGAATVASADEAQTRQRWMLKMDHGPLRTVVVRDVQGRSTAYHYMTIKVTNGTAFARHWHPLVKAITDTKKTYVAGGFAEALPAIRTREGNSRLVSINSTAGRIAAGASLETVAIFGPLDTLYDHVNVQVFGLVDPVAIYKIEQYGQKSPEGAKEDQVVLGADSVIVDSAYWDRNQAILNRLRKAAQEGGGELAQPHVEYQEVAESRYWSVDYERLGDEFHAEDDVIRFVREGWRIDGDPTGLRVISTEG